MFYIHVSVSAGIAVTYPANQGQHKPSEDRGIWECFWKIAGHCARWGQQWWRYFFVIELYSPDEKLEVFSIHKWVKKGVTGSLILPYFVHFRYYDVIFFIVWTLSCFYIT